MNLIEGRKWEFNNFENMGISVSSEYDNLLINKDIDNYFNNIISKPIQISTPQNPIKSNYNLNKFYLDYVEHNLIFIVALVGIIIFLIIRHFGKDHDTFNSDKKPNNISVKNVSDNKNVSDDKNTEKMKKIYQKQNEKINNRSKKLEIEKYKLANYKIKLNKEKQKILSIIDELSNINDLELSNQNNKNNQIYLNQDINTIYSNNYNSNVLRNNNDILAKAHNDIQAKAHNDNMDNFQDNYYNINKMQNDKINEIDGLYIEPPFM